MKLDFAEFGNYFEKLHISHHTDMTNFSRFLSAKKCHPQAWQSNSKDDLRELRKDMEDLTTALPYLPEATEMEHFEGVSQGPYF